MTKMTWQTKLLPFTIPVALFFASSGIGPTVTDDSAMALLVLRNMLEGSGFNFQVFPDPTDISRNIASFMTHRAPGEWLIPGFFVSMGVKYGLAISLTILLATCAGLAGWARIAAKTGAPPFVEFLFVTALATFQFNTGGGRSGGFLNYHGGEVLLFAAAPWSLLASLKCMDARPLIAFGVTLSVAALLFFMKLTGLIVFAATVLALSAVDIARRRRVSGSILAMGIAAAVAALLFQILWMSRGSMAGEAELIGWPPNSFACDASCGPHLPWSRILFPLAAVAVSVLSGLDLVASLTQKPIRSGLPASHEAIFVPFAALGLLVAGWIWIRLRHTPHRGCAVPFFAIIGIYTALVMAMYLNGADLEFDERHLRYASIILLLLLLLATAAEHSPWRVAASLFVLFFALHGLASYVAEAYSVYRSNRFDVVSGVTQGISPAVLQYLRDEQSDRRFDRPIAVVDHWEAVLALPGYRIIANFHDMAGSKWSGRASKIYVIAPEYDLNRVQKVLSAFADYSQVLWKQQHIDGMVIYSQ
jgi:hypothetical protein